MKTKTPGQLQREIDQVLAASKQRGRSHSTKGRDEWKETWDWAKDLWGPDPGYAFNAFFRTVASIRAEREGWEELGSSDVWHASYDTVKDARKRGIKTRHALVETVLDNQDIWGHEKDRLIDRYAYPEHAKP
jgi:hypothetical protein